MGKQMRQMEPEVTQRSQAGPGTGAKSVAFITVGCKLNQFETEQMRELIEADGYAACPEDGAADIFIINTCTVTSKSDYRSRQAVRRAIRSNPDALVMVTGCYAQVAPQEIARIDGVDFVLGNAEKEEILEFIASGGAGKAVEGPLVKVTPVRELPLLETGTRLKGFGRYTRAFVKIQDGCDNRCTYCAVPGARGRSRSKQAGEIYSEIQVLAGEGFREVVLTGVHLGSYGKDLGRISAGGGSSGLTAFDGATAAGGPDAPANLAGLLRCISRVPGLERIRLSSVEPTDFTDGLIETMADTANKIAPHVHVPLQSGDDGVLKQMARPYDRARYAALIERIAARLPRCGIGADVMVGFPGEDDKAFRNTYDLIEALPITYLHVFSYSQRPGTPAAEMDGQVEPGVKKERSRLLRQLGRSKSLEFRRSLLGHGLRVLVLETASGGRQTGLSGNYVKTYFEEPVEANTILECEAVDMRTDGLMVRVRESR
jgi:threonylcarbamoyladenosine tRNA methylthiotransferase MtaB